VIAHAGDVGSPELLIQLGALARVVAGRGNSDRGASAEAVPVGDVAEVGAASLSPLHDRGELDLDPASAGSGTVISGHSHRPTMERKGPVHECRQRRAEPHFAAHVGGNAHRAPHPDRRGDPAARRVGWIAKGDPILAGHYSAAFLAKAAEPRVPLWVLVLAAQAIDAVGAVLLLLGVEHPRIEPGLPANPLDIYNTPYTHSLVGTLVWSTLAFVIVRQWLGSRRAGLATGAVVLSHWWLDLLVHQPDLTLWGAPPELGLSLGSHPAASLAVELALLVGSALLYVRVQSVRSAGRRALAVLVGALAVVQLATAIVSPPLGPDRVALCALSIFFATTWGAYRVERIVDAASA